LPTTRLFLCGLLFGLAALMGGAQAATDPRVFEVRDVPVDATAGGVSEARDQAFAQGQSVAFDILLRRLTLKSDWARLPSSAGQDFKRLISGFAVSSEKRSTTRYIGKLTYNFVPDHIRAILRAAGVPFSETRSKPVLVLPVLQTADGKSLLWEPENLWATAWRDKAAAQALVPVIVPAGDAGDQSASQGISLTAPSWAQLEPMASAKGAATAIVPILALRRAGTQVAASVHLIQLRPSGHIDEQTLSAQGADETAATAAAVDAVTDALGDAWKQSTVIADAGLQTLIVDVTYPDLDGWLRIRGRLKDVPSVRGMRIIALAAEAAELELSYVGSSDQLALTLAQEDLILGPGDVGHYNLESHAPPSPPPPPAPAAAPPGTAAPPPTSGSAGTGILAPLAPQKSPAAPQ
jgi:hypothetical protein